MKQTFTLKKGNISFDKDTITITDNAKKQHRISLFSSSAWTLYGIISVVRFAQTGNQFLLWTGLAIGIANIVALIMMLFRTSKSEIRKSEIVSMEIKQRLGNKFLNIHLEGNKQRRVAHIDDIEAELKQCIATYLEGR